MHEILQAYFARKEAEQAQRQAEKKARLEAERREFLIQEGLFENREAAASSGCSSPSPTRNTPASRSFLVR